MGFNDDFQIISFRRKDYLRKNWQEQPAEETGPKSFP
jgi:hypothetical protein